ncbi:MAG: hypothetical protein ACRCXL_02160 [Dermatophilaceae bacterium]
MSTVIEAALGSRAEPTEAAAQAPPGGSADWDVLSRDLGAAVQPELAELSDRVDGADLVLFCTADGLNLCALGISRRDVGRVSALVSSIFSTATALRTAGRATSEGMTVHLSDDGSSVVLVQVEVAGTGTFILGAHATEVPHAILLIETRRMAERIAVKLSARRR